LGLKGAINRKWNGEQNEETENIQRISKLGNNRNTIIILRRVGSIIRPRCKWM